MKRTEMAVNTFKEGYNCAQSVLHCFHNEVDLKPEVALKMATGFGAGMARTQQCCGAITGAIMVLNLLYGDDRTDVYAKVNQVMDQFTREHGTVVCRELLDDCNLKTEEGQERFGQEGMINRCYTFVESVVHFLEKSIVNQDL